MDNVNKFWEAMEVNQMTAEQVANLFLNYHGTQLLTDDFIQFVEDEGFIIDVD
jgi:hypothetical protein